MVIHGVLDTSILIDYLRGFAPAQDWLDQQRDQIMVITPIVWMEVVQGASNKKKQSMALNFLRNFPLEHTQKVDDEWAMEQVAALSLSSGVRFPDALIASVAKRLEVPLYTQNLKHYVALPGLTVKAPY